MRRETGVKSEIRGQHGCNKKQCEDGSRRVLAWITACIYCNIFFVVKGETRKRRTKKEKKKSKENREIKILKSLIILLILIKQFTQCIVDGEEEGMMGTEVVLDDLKGIVEAYKYII